MSYWYYARDKQKLGPFSTEQMQQLAGAGVIQPTDMVLEEGTQRWLDARSAGLLFPGARVASPGPAETPPPSAPQTAAEVNVLKIEVACPHCGHKMSLNETVRGREIRCPQCNGKYMATPQEAKPPERVQPRERKPLERMPKIRNLVAYQVEQGDGAISIAVSCSCGEVTRQTFRRDQLAKVVTCPACGRSHHGFEED
jgi:DNA-directed RNA polymerase subunit RPC12/RpoP